MANFHSSFTKSPCNTQEPSSPAKNWLTWAASISSQQSFLVGRERGPHSTAGNLTPLNSLCLSPGQPPHHSPSGPHQRLSPSLSRYLQHSLANWPFFQSSLRMQSTIYMTHSRTSSQGSYHTSVLKVLRNGEYLGRGCLCGCVLQTSAELPRRCSMASDIRRGWSHLGIHGKAMSVKVLPSNGGRMLWQSNWMDTSVFLVACHTFLPVRADCSRHAVWDS